jgi:VanZ family protein
VCPHCGYGIGDKVINLCMLVPLGFLLTLKDGISGKPPNRVITTTVIGLLFSLLVEIIQYYLPQRTPSMSDVVMNTLGACIGAFTAIAFLNRLSGGNKYSRIFRGILSAENQSSL